MLDQLESQALLRRLPEAYDLPGATVRMADGRELICLSSNNYLGLASHPSVIEATCKTIQKHGAGATGSRLLSGNLSIHVELEHALAAFKDAPTALLFNSGYVANLSLLSALVEPHDLLVCDKLNHASLIDGARLSGAEARYFRHLDYDRAEEHLARDRTKGRKFIVTDAVFSMDGDVADLPRLLELCRKYQARLIIDEAHSTGVLGARGRGIFEHFKLSASDDVIRMGTLGKALGSYGAFVVCDIPTRDLLINRARPWIYSTALPPAALGAALESLRLITENPGLFLNSLHFNFEYLRSGLRALGYSISKDPTPIIPLIIGEAEAALKASQSLNQAGILAHSIRPPTVAAGSSRLRMSVMATHKKEHLDQTLQAIGALRL